MRGLGRGGRCGREVRARPEARGRDRGRRSQVFGRPPRREVVGHLGLRLVELLAGLGREPVGEDGAEGVVGLVLEAPREQAVSLEGHRRPVDAGARHPGAVGPGAVDEGAGEGQAALLGLVELAVLALGQLHDRVAHHAHRVLAGRVGAVEDEDPQVDADLAGGETDAVGGVHRGHHVGDQRAQVVVVRRHVGLRTVHHRRAPARHRPDGAALGQPPVRRVQGRRRSWPGSLWDRRATTPLTPQ